MNLPLDTDRSFGLYDYAVCAGCGWKGPFNQQTCPSCGSPAVFGYESQTEEPSELLRDLKQEQKRTCQPIL